jgi:hypothetical protein
MEIKESNIAKVITSRKSSEILFAADFRLPLALGLLDSNENSCGPVGP